MQTELKPSAPARRILGSCARASTRQIVWAVLFFVSTSVGLAVLRHLSIPRALGYAIPVFPLFDGVQYLRALVNDMRRQMDELQLRIYMEAATVAVCGLFILMVAYPVLEAAHLAVALDYSVVMALVVGLGIAGYISGVRRYR